MGSIRAIAVCCTALAIGAFARDTPTGLAAAGDPVCGPSTKFVYLEQDAARSGLAVNLIAPAAARTGAPVTLRMLVLRQPGDLAVDNLQPEGDKLFHVVGIRDDLSGFFHVHPTKIAPGIWEVNHVFTNGGNYKIWSDLRFGNICFAAGHPIVSVAGDAGEPPRRNERPDLVVQSGHQITFKHTEPLFARRSASLQFLVRDMAGREVEMEPYMGEPMHLMLVKSDLSVYRHMHPDRNEPARPGFSFTTIFPAGGRYKLFAQFRPKGTTLPADDAILASFDLNVFTESYAPGSDTIKGP